MRWKIFQWMKAIGKKGAILWLFSWQISLEIDQFGADQTSINEPMAKPLISWLVPSFSQHNLHLVVSGRCLHVSVTKFQDKFASLRQVNSPYSWNKFQICCTDMYLIRFLPNFAGFRGFTWISRLRDRAKYQKPWNTHLFLGWWRWGLHYLLCNRLSITMTFKFF